MSGLSSIDLFADLAPDAIAEIEAGVRWHRFAADDEIFDKESDSYEVYFVVEGTVRILSYADPDREVMLASVGAGTYFGELAAIDGRGRSARVVASEPALLASIDGSEFMALMLSHPTIGIRVIERFARIIRALDSRVLDLSTLNESQRVVVELVRLAEPDPKDGERFLIPDLPSHKDLASWAGTSRETVAETIGELARIGVVERRNMGMLVHDWNRLKALARSD